MNQPLREYRSPRSGEIAAFLSRHAHQMRPYGDELRFRPCPKCRGNNVNNPPIQINVKSGLWRCFKCGSVGNWYQLTKLFGEPLHHSDRYKIPEYQDYDFNVISKFLNETRRPIYDGHYPNLYDYCINRGIGVETMKDWRISSKGPFNMRWPIYDLIGGKFMVVNMKVKSIDPNATTKEWFDVRGGPTDLLIGNHLLDIDGPKRAIIFEGQFDAMTAYQLGLRNVFSLPNGASNVNVAAMLRFIPTDWEILICPDMDQAGDLCAEKFFAQLGTERVKRLRLPFKDLNDWLKEDPFITDKQVLATATNADHLFIDNTGFIKLDMTAEIIPTTRIVCRTPWDELNDKLAGGLYEGQTTGLLGPSGQGKTTWVNQLGIYVAANQIPVGLISVEGSRDDLTCKLRETIVGGWDRPSYKIIESHLFISPLMGHNFTEIDLYKEVSRLIESGSRLIILDNLDHIFRGDSQKKSNAYGFLIDQAISHKIHMIVIWQPHKVDRGQIVNSGSQKGFSMSLQDADNYLNLNRVGNAVCVEIEKTRQRGISVEDNKMWFDWDKEKRIYTPQNRFTNKKFGGKLIALT